MEVSRNGIRAKSLEAGHTKSFPWAQLLGLPDESRFFLRTLPPNYRLASSCLGLDSLLLNKWDLAEDRKGMWTVAKGGNSLLSECSFFF